MYYYLFTILNHWHAGWQQIKQKNKGLMRKAMKKVNPDGLYYMHNLDLARSLNTKGNNEKGKDTALNYSHSKHRCSEMRILVSKSLLKKSFHPPSLYQYMIKKQILNYNSDVFFCLGCKCLES